MKPFIVGLDVDDVLAELVEEWVRRYNAKYQDNVRREEITDWDVTIRMNKAPKDEVYGLLGAGDFYHSVRPTKGSVEAVRKLRERTWPDGTPMYRIIFVTSCLSFDSASQKFEWLVRHGFFGRREGALTWEARAEYMKDYFPVKDKSLVRTDLLVDDNIDNVSSAPGMAFLMNQPHNKGRKVPPHVVRVNDMNTVRLLLQEMHEPL